LRRVVLLVLMAFVLALALAGPAWAGEGRIVFNVSPGGAVGQASDEEPTLDTVESGIEGSDKGNLVLDTAEDAIERAKEVFPELIRGREKELRVDYRDDRYEGRTYWSLRWDRHVSEGMQNYFNIRLDAGDGRLLNFSRRMDSESGEQQGQVITREKAKQVALTFARRHHPDKLAEMVPDADYRVQGGGNDLDLVYSFRWYQEVDGIPLNDNNIYVRVDALSGQVTSFGCRWRDNARVDAGKAMDAGELTKQVTNKLGLYPEYVVENRPNYSNLPGADLVYRLNTKYHRFSAQSGKPVDNRGNEVDWDEAKLFEQELTPVPAGERKGKVKQNGQALGYIDAQKIAEKFFKQLGLKGRAERSGSGSSSGPGYREEYWSYRLVTGDDRELFSGGSQIRVSINTATGEVQRYYNRTGDDRGDSQEEEGIPREKAFDAARDFLKVARPGALKDMVLRQDFTDYYPKGKIPYYKFTWVRLVNGVPYTGDTVRVTVSRYSGEVREFYRQSRPVKSFASTKDIITREEAAKALEQTSPFKLSYDRMRDPDKDTGKTLLVFRADYGRGINAHTGEKYESGMDKAEAGSYQAKLQNHWARVPLMLLGDSGLLPPPEEFDPSAAVSRREGLKVLGVAGTRYYHPPHPLQSPFKDVTDNDQDIMSIMRAVDSGIVAEGGKLRPGAPLTREDLAVWLVIALGYKEVAGAPISMAVNFKDDTGISAGKENYVAIAAGLGLMSGDVEGKFRPREPVTWGELASVVIKAAPKLK